MSEDKTIYNLDLHESMTVIVRPIDKKGFPYECQVTRVASGWIYQDSNPKTTIVSQFFVPFDNSFQTK